MITPIKLYLITRLDGIVNVCGIVGVLGLIVAAASVIIAGSENSLANSVAEIGRDYDKAHLANAAQAVWFARRALAVSAVAILAAVLTPSTKEMAAIIVVPRIANNERLQEAGNRLFDLATAWMEELSPKKKGGAE